MRVSSLIRGSIASFRVNLFRSFLALLGIIFGVSSVIAMITIGEGAQRQILDNINALGADLVHIQEGNLDRGQLAQSINESVGLSFKDVKALQTVLPMAGRDVGYLTRFKARTTNLPLQAGELSVFAVSANFVELSQLDVVAGRDFDRSDFRYANSVAILSRGMAVQLFSSPEKALDRTFRLDQRWFRVVGVFDRKFRPAKKGSKRGFPKDYGIFEKSMVLPFPTYLEKIESPKVYSALDKIILKCRSLIETNRMKDAAERILSLTHNGVRDYKIFSPQELLDQQQSTQEIFNIVLLSIASISLLVGGIGIMNIMLANVLERRVEIGIRRALGAKRRHIIFQFLFESVMVCLVGGLLGIALGMGIGFFILKFTKIPVAFSVKPIAISFLISFSVGVFFGIMPAREAANLNPVEALHEE